MEVAETTVVVVEDELSAACSSLVVLLTEAASVMPAPVPAVRLKEMLTIATPPAGNVAIVKVIAPVLAPTSGNEAVKAGPDSCASERKVTPSGTALTSTTF